MNPIVRTDAPTATEMVSTTVFELGVQNDEVIDVNGQIFDADAYSRFKYGDGSVVSEYAELVAEDLISNHGDDLEEGYIASSAYKHVPTAAYAISKALVSELVLRDHPPAGIFRIDRSTVRSNDYSALSEEERIVCAQNNGLVLPEVANSELQGKTAFVVDDIKITGTHERALHNVLGGIGLKKVLFSYVAVVDPKIAEQHPAIEYEINHAYVQNLTDLVPLAKSPDFMLNARTCKFILTASKEDLKSFVGAVPSNVAMHILSSMVSDGYHKMDKFQGAFKTFASAVSAKHAHRQIKASRVIKRVKPVLA